MRQRGPWILVVLPALFLFLAGCSDGTVAPGTSADGFTAEIADIVLETDGLVETVLEEEMVSVAAAEDGTAGGTSETTVTFSRTRSCPGGGEVVVEGELHRTFDSGTRTMEASFSGTRTMTDCVFSRGDHTVTVNSSSMWDAFRRKVDGAPDGPQTTHLSGSFHAVRSDGEERSCTWDVTIVWDPDTRTRTVEGTICGEPVHRVRGG